MLNEVGSRTIETDRLLLRRFKKSDDDNMIKYWISDEKIQSLYGEPVYSTKEEVNELLSKFILSYERSNYYRWAITLKDTDECIGQIAYFLVDEKNHFAEIEYCIGSGFQCKGLMTEAVKAVVKYGFDEINLHKVQISHKSINIPSKRVIEKCGFTYEGTLRDYFYNGNTTFLLGEKNSTEYVDRLFYSILRSEYYN